MTRQVLSARQRDLYVFGRGRYDRMTDTIRTLTGEAPTNMREFVKLHAAEFKQGGSTHL
jgi:hypothetical protein